jgi:hypothetical protein
MRRLVLQLVVVDPEDASKRRDDRHASDLRRKETRLQRPTSRPALRSHDVRNTDADGVSRYFIRAPLDPKGDGRAADHSKIVAVMRVLPNVFGVHNY